jgi:hypothetical protein
MTITRAYADDLPVSLQTLVDQYALFSSRGFARLWEAMGGRPVYWIAGDTDAPEAILCGVEFGWGALKRFQSMPDGCYSRLVRADKQVKDDAASAALLGAIAKAGYAKFHVYDYCGSFEAAHGIEVTECHTSLVDISSPDWQPPDRTLQSEIRKAERDAVTSASFDADRHMDAFLKLMIQTEQRHGRRPRYTREFVCRLAHLAQADDRVVWKVVEHEGELAASHINFIDSGLMLNWQVCFDKRFSFLKPNQLLLYSAARYAAGRGIRVLNLGTSPEDAETLVTYKRKWGGEDYAYRCLQRYSWLGKLM